MEAFAPQQWPTFAVVTPHACPLAPALTFSHFRPDGTAGTGATYDPKQRAQAGPEPASLDPQQMASQSEVIPQLKALPALTDRKVVPFGGW